MGPGLCPPSAQQEVTGHRKMTLSLYLLPKNRQRDARTFPLPRLIVFCVPLSAPLSMCHRVSSASMPQRCPCNEFRGKPHSCHSCMAEGASSSFQAFRIGNTPSLLTYVISKL